MPVSDLGSVQHIVHAVCRLQPKGILDLGIGMGKYGTLLREALEAVHGRCRPEEWEFEICGVEGHKEYANPCWKMYDDVAIEDFTQHYEKIKNWPLVMMIDSLEHTRKETAYEILDHLVENNKNVIVSVPLGYCPQGAVFDNEYERHRSTWDGPGDFAQYNAEVLYSGVCLVVLLKGMVN